MIYLKENIAYLKSLDTELDLSEDPTLSELETLAEQLGIPLDVLLLRSMQHTDLPWSDIRFVFLDVDGVLTEGGMFYTESGDEFKRFDTKDGMAIKQAMQKGITFGIVSSGVNQSIIQHRAEMFGIEHVYVGTDPKLEIAAQWLDKLGLSWEQVGYIGDDINDLQMFDKSRIAACPSDATQPIKEAADFVLQSKGGHGCVREYLRCFPPLIEVL
ncbi:MAG: HAD hydrolase family protein [Flavobacteriales bacterium]|nr:HAD hydrolase family protein [Flavobacteriales bacterium]